MSIYTALDWKMVGFGVVFLTVFRYAGEANPDKFQLLSQHKYKVEAGIWHGFLIWQNYSW